MADADIAAVAAIAAQAHPDFPERAAVFSGAFREVFLTLLMKDEIGADVFDDALRVLVRGVALQLMEPKS